MIASPAFAATKANFPARLFRVVVRPSANVEIAVGLLVSTIAGGGRPVSPSSCAKQGTVAIVRKKKHAFDKRRVEGINSGGRSILSFFIGMSVKRWCLLSDDAQRFPRQTVAKHLKGSGDAFPKTTRGLKAHFRPHDSCLWHKGVSRLKRNLSVRSVAEKGAPR